MDYLKELRRMKMSGIFDAFVQLNKVCRRALRFSVLRSFQWDLMNHGGVSFQRKCGAAWV